MTALESWGFLEEGKLLKLKLKGQELLLLLACLGWTVKWRMLLKNTILVEYAREAGERWESC
jgi:hypothetical protein